MLFVSGHTVLNLFTSSLHQLIFEKNQQSLDKIIYFATKNQNSIQEEIKGRLKSGNACHHLVQSLLCSSSLSKNVKIKTNRTIILPVFVRV
jgi:hypothetical protein